jgi:hypothetical protein
MHEKATPPIKPDQIDEIVMVGGSSKIPMIAQRLEQEFGRTPRLIEPDLCVAIGAAILAGTRGQQLGAVKLDTIPSETDLPYILVSGKVQASGQVPQVAGCRVTLRAADGSYQRTQQTPETGGFAFQQVPLAPEATTEFLLRIAAPAGEEILNHRFTVRQSAQAGQGPSGEGLETNILAKPIRIMTVDGMQVVAPERTPLPFECSVPAETTGQAGSVRVPIYEENNLLGEIVVDHLPTTLPIGSIVEITLSIQRNFQIFGRAYIPAAAREGHTVVQLPPVIVKSLEELKAEFQELSMRGNEALAVAGRGQIFGGGLGKRLREGLAAVQEMLNNEREADCAKIQDRMGEVATLIEQLSAGWRPKPSHEDFTGMVQEVETLIEQVCAKDPAASAHGYDHQLQAIRDAGEKAFVDKNPGRWQEANNHLVNLRDRLQAILDRGKGGDGPPPDPQALKVELGKDLARLHSEAKRLGRLPALEREFQTCSEALKRIDPRAGDALSQISDYFFTKHQPLAFKVTGEESPDLGKFVRIKDLGHI